jgi:putative redox protein
MPQVSGYIEQGHYKTIISSQQHELVADEPASKGGTGLGLEPEELLCSALSACTCITLRMYADRKKWGLTGVQAQISLVSDKEKNITRIKRDITLTGDLTNEQKMRLMGIANQCPVHKILSNPIEIDTVMVP